MIYGTTDKRALVSIFLLFIALASFGQRNKDSLSKENLPKSLDQRFIDPNSATVLELRSLYDNRPNYIYNGLKDTIRLSSIDSSSTCFCAPPKVASRIQLDKKGAKEIVFYRKCLIQQEFYQSSFRQTITKTVKKYEIWNLETKQLLFEATPYCKSHFDGTIFQSGTLPKRKKSSHFYQYHFRMNKKGTIQIKQRRGKLQQLAKIKEGTYLFSHGKYALKE